MAPPPAPVTNRMSDEELVAAYVGGSNEAFSLLVGRYKDPLVNFAWRIVGDRDAAVDVVQETFIRLHGRAHTYRPVARFSTWIYTIASNLAKSELRRRKWGFSRGRETDRGTPRADDPRDPGILPDEAAARAVAAGLLERALADLPDSFRQAVVLFYIEEKSYEEICLILGVRMGTLKSRLSRARTMLEAALGPTLGRDDDD